VSSKPVTMSIGDIKCDSSLTMRIYLDDITTVYFDDR